MIHKRQKVSIGSCWTDPAGLMHFEFWPGASLSAAEGRAVTALCEEETRGRPRPTLVDCTRARSISLSAQRYFFEDPSHLRTYSAVAIVSETLMGRLAGSLFVALLKPERPARFFRNEASAVRWLKSLST